MKHQKKKMQLTKCTGTLKLRTICHHGPPWGISGHWLLEAKKTKEGRIREEMTSQVLTKKSLTKPGKGRKFPRC